MFPHPAKFTLILFLMVLLLAAAMPKPAIGNPANCTVYMNTPNFWPCMQMEQQRQFQEQNRRYQEQVEQRRAEKDRQAEIDALERRIKQLEREMR